MSYALEITNLQQYYGEFAALKNINLKVEHGDFFALLGPNGAGKSTMINIICSLLPKGAGQIKVLGLDLAKHASSIKMKVGLVPQEFNFAVFETVIQVLIYQAGFFGIQKNIALERAEKYLKLLNLWDKRNARVISLSGGMKRRLMIVRALMHEPKVLILDEPTSGVDVVNRYTMWDFLRQINANGVTIILTTHNLEEAEKICKRCAIIDDGLIIADDSMQNLLAFYAEEKNYIISLKKPYSGAFVPIKFKVKMLDSNQLEASISKGESFYEFMEYLHKHNIEINDITVKANRLEQLFLKLTASETY